MSEIWKDGRFLPADAPAVAADDRGLLLGDGLFETVKCRDGQALRWRRHRDRLAEGAGLLGIPLPAALAGIEAIAGELLRRNGLADAVLRLTLTRGSGERGLLPPAEPRPTLLLSSAPLPPTRPPARAILAATARRDERSILARVKSLNYLEGVLARMEAAGRGADEAILLNTAGRPAEASAANLFLAIDRQLVTPPVAEGALPGTMRAEIMATERVLERPIEIEDLARASEAFLSSSLGIRALVAIDGRSLADGETGPVTRRIAAAIERTERPG